MSTCISCELEPEEQAKHKHPEFVGLCFPGRCVVNYDFWFMWSDGTPVERMIPNPYPIAPLFPEEGLAEACLV